MNILLLFQGFLYLLSACRLGHAELNKIRNAGFHETAETFRNVPNKRIKSTIGRSIIQCSIKCMNTECCTAFNFSPQSGLCELMTPVRMSSLLTTTTTALPQQAHEILEFEIEWYPANCWDIKARYPTVVSGVYTIYVKAPHGDLRPVDVWCDMATDGGGWTAMLRRFDGSVKFYQDYADYVDVIGNAHGEYWIGLENIHAITSLEQYELRVDIQSHSGNAWAKYHLFSLNGAADKFRLSVSQYNSSSTAGDGLTFHNGRQFSTRDVPSACGSSTYCGRHHKGAWWYACCYQKGSQLLSEYRVGALTVEQGLSWQPYKGTKYSLKRVEMQIRPLAEATREC